MEQAAANSEQERRSSSLRRENRDSVKEVTQNGNNGNVAASKSVANNSAVSSSPQKTGRISNGNMNSGNMNSVIFPLLSDVSVCVRRESIGVPNRSTLIFAISFRFRFKRNIIILVRMHQRWISSICSPHSKWPNEAVQALVICL